MRLLLDTVHALYEHFGYEIVGSNEVGPTLTTWTIVRRDAAR